MAFVAFLRGVGAPVDSFLRDAKLPVLCDDPNVFVPLERAWSFFATATQREDPLLGWLVGANVGDNNLNRGFLQDVVTTPTLFQALQRLVKLASAEASHLRLGMYKRRVDVLLYTHYPGMRNVPGYPTSQAYQLGVIRGLIRHFLGPGWNPEEIGIEHTIATPTILEQGFCGSRILTQQPFGYLTVPHACLHCKARFNIPKSGVADDLVLAESFDDVDRLRELIKSYLPDGYTSARFAAELLGVSERTLARRLSARGLTFGALVDEVRFDVAKTLLQRPDARIAEVAGNVGFDDQANFTRMFRRVSGFIARKSSAALSWMDQRLLRVALH